MSELYGITLCGTVFVRIHTLTQINVMACNGKSCKNCLHTSTLYLYNYPRIWFLEHHKTI